MQPLSVVEQLLQLHIGDEVASILVAQREKVVAYVLCTQHDLILCQQSNHRGDSRLLLAAWPLAVQATGQGEGAAPPAVKAASTRAQRPPAPPASRCDCGSGSGFW